MAQKLLKAREVKIAPKRDAVAETRVVLVGTYKEKQLAWIKANGVYNYPVKEGDELTDEACGKVSELWLYADAKGARHAFAAQFVGKMSKEEFLAAYPTYAKLPSGRARTPSAPQDQYCVFTVTPLDYGPAADGRFVVVRAADFEKGRGRTKSVKKAVEQFKADGEFAPLAAYLPSDLAKVPSQQLRVCEAAVQLDFMLFLRAPAVDACGETERPIDLFKGIRNKPVAKVLNLVTLNEPTGFTHVDCFSGVGGFCTGLHAAGFSTLVAIEKIKSCVETYQANHPEVHVVNNDICKVAGEDVLPYCPKEGVDLVTSGMPCETFSTAGNTSRSFYDERQFLFREGIRIAQITNAKFLLFENVPAITTKTVSKTSKELIVDVLKEELVRAGYRNYIARFC